MLCSFNFNFDGLRLSGIERSNYIETNNLGRKCCPVSGIERIRYSGCFITLKIEGNNSGPRKSSGFVGIPVLRGSGLEGFYCTIVTHMGLLMKSAKQYIFSCLEVNTITLYITVTNKMTLPMLTLPEQC